MNLTTGIILAVVAFVTATISAILGMGGGVVLLAVMMCFMSHGEAIPTHAAVQIASNGTRVLAFIKNVDGSALGRFVLGVIPGATIGFMLLWSLGQAEESEPYLKTIMGAYILVAPFLPKRRSGDPATSNLWGFSLIGLAAGAAALTVGAVGPLIAPVFARYDFVKERLIATKAVCQLTTHVLKIPAFLLLRPDLELMRLSTVALVMIIVVIPGTLLGKRMLRNFPERHFRLAFRTALVLAGLKVLIVDGLRNLPIWS